MKISLYELTPDQVIGINQRVILDSHRRHPKSKQQHSVVRANDLESCIGAIFFQGRSGYVHLPLEKMAGLLLYRIAQGQFFIDGNKRTAVVAATIFLRNHGLTLRLDRATVNDLMWGFAVGEGGTPAKYKEENSVQFIFDNVLPRA